jgi:hypothetical protein
MPRKPVSVTGWRDHQPVTPHLFRLHDDFTVARHVQTYYWLPSWASGSMTGSNSLPLEQPGSFYGTDPSSSP